MYIVNNKKSNEPLHRITPPFNDTQISDALNQSRTMVYTPQLFSLYFDIENGYISREEARTCFMIPGLADFHRGMKSLGEPYHYYQGDTVICLEMCDDMISVGDKMYYEDNLNRLHSIIVEGIQQENKPLESVSKGKTAFKVNEKVPRNIAIMVPARESD